MIQKLGAALPFAAFFVESKVGKTGLTVTVDVFEKGLGVAATQIITGASATEVGGGLYTYELAAASVDANGSYWAVFKTSTGTVDAQHIPSAWLTPVWLTQLGTATVTLTAPVTSDGTLTLVQGDDYLSADGASLDFTFVGLSYSLVAATSIKLSLRHRNTGTITTVTGSVLGASSCRFEPTATVTDALTVGEYDYDIQAVLANTHVRTPLRGRAQVLADYTP